MATYLRVEYPILGPHDIIQLPVLYPSGINLIPLLQQEKSLHSATLCSGTCRHQENTGQQDIQYHHGDSNEYFFDCRQMSALRLVYDGGATWWNTTRIHGTLCDFAYYCCILSTISIHQFCVITDYTATQFPRRWSLTLFPAYSLAK